jgi:hypothetical protein
MAEQNQLSDSKVSEMLGLKMGLDPTGSMVAPKAPAMPKAPEESKSIIPQIDYTGMIKGVDTPQKALEMKAGLLNQQQQIQQNIGKLEQEKSEKEAELKLKNIQESNIAIREEYEKMDKFYKDFPRPEFHPTKENMQDIATLFSLIGVVGTLLGGSGKSAAMSSLSSMTGMMKGWREGRSDLWKKELQEFEKSMNVWKLKLEEARDGLKRALELQATNRQEADALATMTIAKLGSPIFSEKYKLQGIQSAYTLANEVGTAVDKEIKKKFDEKGQEETRRHNKAMEGFRQREIDYREKEGGAKATQQRFVAQRAVNALGGIASAVESISLLPSGTTLGILPNLTTKDGMTNYLRNFAGRTVSKQEEKALETLFSGVTRNLASIEASGAATGLVGLATQLEKLRPVAGDTAFDVALKMADIRRIATENTRPLIESGLLPAQQAQVADALIQRVEKAVPYTTNDVIAAIPKKDRKTIEESSTAIAERGRLNAEKEQRLKELEAKERE